MTQELFFGLGTVTRLPDVLDRFGAGRVFLVTGQASFAASGAARAIEPALRGRAVHRHCNFGENPKLSEIRQGVEALRSDRFDMVVAVGGGSVMDTAKLVNVFAHQDVDPLELIGGNASIHRRGLPLVAVPTTAGSGSEATHFGVVYVDRVKHSVAHPSLLPDTAIVDPALTFSLSPTLTAVTGMDAFSQAVESYWCIHSTETSKELARRAIALAVRHLRGAVNAPAPANRCAMSEAALLAGRAINITKTTGAHALSYPLTSHFGIPHGHAVCLTLGEFLLFNSRVTDRDVTDARGAEYVRQVVQELVRMMDCSDAESCRASIEALIADIGLSTRLGALGISCDEAIAVVVSNVNVERMVNNPRALNHDSLEQLVHAIC